jgi:simple sugar transport system permease protein
MAEAARPAADERLTREGPLTALVKRPDMGAVIGAVAVFLLFAWTARNVSWISDLGIYSQWSDQAAQYGVVAVPVALLMIAGEFDLSAGVMVGSSGLLLGLLTVHWHVNIWPAIAIVLLASAAIGFINGYTVVRTKLPSFIVTLGTFFILQGVNAGGTLKLTGTVAVNDIDGAHGFDSARPLFASTFWSPYDFKVEILWWLAIAVLGAFVLARTRFGNWIFAVGGDATAARNVGVPVARTKIALFMATSVTSGLLGIITAISLRSIQANEGVGREFIFIIAAVVGGCLLTGGYGSVVGSAFGAAVLGMAQIGIILSQWDSNWVFAFQGVILMLAVMLNAAIRTRAGRARTR